MKLLDYYIQCKQRQTIDNILTLTRSRQLRLTQPVSGEEKVYKKLAQRHTRRGHMRSQQ